MTYFLETPHSGSGDVTTYNAGGSTLVFADNITCASYSGQRPGNITGENVTDGFVNIPFQFVNTSAYDKYAFTERVKENVVIIFLVLAVVLNTLSFATMQRRRLRRLTPSIYLRCLAITDTSSVVFFACNQSTLLKNLGVHTDVTCGLTRSLQHAFMMMSAWVTVALTVERFISVNHPMYRRKKALCSRKHAIWSIAAITMCCLVISMFFIGNMHFVHEGDIARCVNVASSHDLMNIYHDVICTGLIIVVPSAVIVCVNGLVVNRLVRQRQQILSHPKLQAAATEATSTGDSPIRVSFVRKLPADKITVMLLVVSLYFPLCASPRIFDQLVYKHCIHLFNVLDVTSDEQADFTADTNMRFSILQLVMFTNYFVNFFLYILFGRTFRRAFAEMMRETWLCRAVGGESLWGQGYVSAWSVRSEFNENERTYHTPPSTDVLIMKVTTV